MFPVGCLLTSFNVLFCFCFVVVVVVWTNRPQSECRLVNIHCLSQILTCDLMTCVFLFAPDMTFDPSGLTIGNQSVWNAGGTLMVDYWESVSVECCRDPSG